MQRAVLITGASTGFGHEAATRFARRGYRTFATMRDAAGRNGAARQALERIGKDEGLALDVLDLDVTDDASVGAAVDQALTRAGRLDVVVNNAGLGCLGVSEAFTPEQFAQVFDVNLFGVVRVNRAVLPAMRRQGSGLLIHVSSGAGRLAIPALAPYCTSKFALEALADVYRYELRPFGIDSIVVEPGTYKTEILGRFIPPADTERAAAYGSDFAERVHAVFEGARLAPETPGPEEVAELFVTLAEMPAGQRPFRSVLPAPLAQLLDGYNQAAEGIRPIIAQIFNVPELAG
jgi:NAD(P)-dependent dehydrogenase (short-subunit alcohol dehydrogenase family)